MTKKEWKALKKEKGMKVYVLRCITREKVEK